MAKRLDIARRDSKRENDILPEMSIDREGRVDAEHAHDLEAHAINQAEPSRLESRMVMHLTARYDVPSATVQAIIVRAEADAERAQNILPSLNWSALDSLLRQ